MNFSIPARGWVRDAVAEVRAQKAQVAVGDRVLVIEWVHREPLTPIDGWVVEVTPSFLTISSSPDDRGGAVYDMEMFMRASFFVDQITVEPWGWWL